MSQTSANCVITQKMIDDQVQPDTFTSPLHYLSMEVKLPQMNCWNLSNPIFKKDETCIRMTNLTKMQIDTCNSSSVSQKPYPIAMKHYNWVKHEINKLLYVKVIHCSHSSWSPLIMYQKSVYPMPKVNDIFSKLNGLQYFSTLDLQARSLKQPSHHLLKNMTTWKFLLDYENTCILSGTLNKVLKDLPFTIAYLDDIIIYSMSTKDHMDHLQQVFCKLLYMKLSICHFFTKNPIFRSYPKHSR